MGSIDQALNRLTANMQDLDFSKMSRPVGRANKFLAFDANGKEYASSDVPGMSYRLADARASAVATPATVFQIMNQVPSLLNYTGGTVSASRATNSDALDALILDMAARGRAEYKFPSGEVPLARGHVFAGGNQHPVGGGDSATIFTYPTDVSSDLLVMTGNECSLRNVGIYAPGQTTGAAFKFHGCQGTAMEALFAVECWIGIEGYLVGGMTTTDCEILNAGYSSFFPHDDVQGWTVWGGTFNPGSEARGIGGNIRTRGMVSALRMHGTECLSGLRSLDTGPNFDGSGNRILDVLNTLGYSKFVGLYLDGAARDSIIDGSIATEFLGLHNSNARADTGYNGITLRYNRGLSFIGGSSNNNGRHGVDHENTNIDTQMIGFDTHNNGYTSMGSSAGKNFQSGSSNFDVTGGSSGNGEYGINNQEYGVNIEAGCTDYSVTNHNVRTNFVSGIRDVSQAGFMQNNRGGEATDRVAIGGGSAIKASKKASVVWNPASIPDGAIAVTYITGLTGVTKADGWTCAATFSSIADTGWFLSATVHLDNQIAVTLMNKTGGAVDLASGTVTVTLTRSA